jgi:ribosome modulation factor
MLAAIKLQNDVKIEHSDFDQSPLKGELDGFLSGICAHLNGIDFDECPFEKNHPSRLFWMKGWLEVSFELKYGSLKRLAGRS